MKIVILIATVASMSLLGQNSTDFGNYRYDLPASLVPGLLSGDIYARCYNGNQFEVVAFPPIPQAPVVLYQGTSNDCDEYQTWKQYTISQVVSLYKRSAFTIITGIRATTPTTLVPTVGRPPVLLPLPLGPNLAPAQAVTADPGCVASAQPTVYVVNHLGPSLTAVSGCPPTTSTIALQATRPNQVEITPDGTTAVVTHYDNAISFVNILSNTLTYTLNTPPTIFPNGIRITPDGTTAYVTSYIDTNPMVFTVNLSTHTIVNQIPMPLAFPESLSMTPDGAQVWITFYQQNTIAILDTLTNTISNMIAPTFTPRGIAFDSTGRRAFIAGASSSEVVVMNTQTLSVVTRIPVGQAPSDVVLSPDDQRLYVANMGSGAVSIIDAANYQVLGTQSAEVGLYGLTIFW